MSSKLSQLNKKIFITLGIVLFYRFGSYIPLPYIDVTKISLFSDFAKSGIFSVFNTFSGGAIARASIFALGIMPYITASIIVQVMTSLSPEMAKIRSEGGEEGNQKINLYTKYITIAVALLQGGTLLANLHNMGVTYPVSKLLFISLNCSVILCGTMVLIWLGEYGTSNGISNGTSIIIFAGIVAESPRDMVNAFKMSYDGSISPIALLALFAIFGGMILFVTYVERAQRLITIQHPQQSMMIAKMPNMQKQNFLPLKLNIANVIPPIFASAILLLPTTIIKIFSNGGDSVSNFIAKHMSHGSAFFILLYSACIVLFSYFYCNVLFDVKAISSNLKRSGVFIPGIRPGEATSNALRIIANRLAGIGSVYLLIICLIPELLSPVYGYSFLLGGTGILIVVGVITDITTNFQTHMLSSKYSKSLRKK
jgi:preprotein translocase subunit SecY